jgi:Amt family ammonium transporter
MPLVKPNITDTQQYLLYLEDLVNQSTRGADTAWISSCTYLVFLMQLGFCLLELGSVKYKVQITVLIKAVIDMTVTSIAWWIIGYGIAFGESHVGVIGINKFAGVGIESYSEYSLWMFQWAFAGTAATIVSGCIVERMNVWTYVYYSFFLIAWVYAMIAHWAWSPHGWMNVLGYIDFAGCGVVHLVGGTAGLISTIMLKPRNGRFEEKNQNDFKPSNPTYVTLGTFLLWFSWYGFNCGSTISVVGDNVTYLVGKIGMNTSISASSGGIACFLIYFVFNEERGKYSIIALCNGVLAGLIGITSCCNTVESWCAFFIGILSAIVYYIYTIILAKLKIDDPIDAIALHMGCGSFGLIAVGWFDPSKGVLYGKGALQFGYQLMGLVIIFLWTFVNGFLFLIWFKIAGKLRITEEEEIYGTDYFKAGGYILNYDEVTLKHYAEMFFKNMENKEPLPTPTENDADDNNVNLELSNQKSQQAEQMMKEDNANNRKKTNDVLKTKEIL